MNHSKQLAYKVWLDELNTTPSEAFFPTFRQLLNLLIKDNPSKIEILNNKIDNETKWLVNTGNEAIKDLEELLVLVEDALKNQNDADISQIEHYKQVKSGKIKVLGEDLPDTLYHALRLTIEKHRNNGLLKNFGDELLGVNDNFWYLDYAKVCEAYPRFKKFRNTKEAFTQRQKEEAWGAITYLNWAKTFFKDVFPEQAGNFVKAEIIDNMRCLILYLLTPDEYKRKQIPKKLTGIKSLFALSDNPVGIYYEGKANVKRTWVYPKGKIQPYAILKQASEKNRKRISRPDVSTKEIKLSYIEIEGYLSNPKNCDRHPSWKGILTHKRRLEHLRKNILRLIPFDDSELKVEESNHTAFLVFRPQR